MGYGSHYHLKRGETPEIISPPIGARIVATFVLGPFQNVVDAGPQPPPPVPTPGQVGIRFDPLTPYVMGGTANVQLLAPVAVTDALPTNILVYLVPLATFQALATPLTPAAIMGLTGISVANYPVPNPAPAALTTIPITVAPTPPAGAYVAATVLAYP